MRERQISSPDELAAIDSLLRLVDRSAPGAIADAIATSLADLGVSGAEVLLVDYESEQLTGLAREGGSNGRVERVRDSAAGSCFTGGEPVVDESGPTLWVPIMERGNAIGVLGVSADRITEGLRRHADRVATVAAHLVATSDRYTDAYVDVRERKVLSLPAELQWSHLPPESFASDRLVIAATVEPAYDIAGDAFDYNVADGYADFALLDAMGHGLRACLDGLVAVTALRAARRARAPLPLMAQALAEAVRQRRARTTFVTTVFGRLNLDDGTFSWVNAGHLEPWIVARDGSRTRLESARRPPAGVLEDADTPDYPVMTSRLDPGDMLVLMSDGVLDDGDPDAGAERVVRRIADEYSRNPRSARVAIRTVAREILRRSRGRLTDDATVMMLVRPV